MAVAAPVADPSAALKMPAPQSIADKVKAQLAGDYPPGALDWVDDLQWLGPTRVPMDQIDRSAGDWSAADDKRKVAAFAKRISAGWRKPVVAIRRPGTRLLCLVDGHTRAAACAQIGQPLTAWIGTAQTATGPWLKIHSRQMSNDLPALELAGMFSEQLHPRVPKGHQGGGRFGSANTPLTAKAASGTPTGRLAPEGPEPPAELQRIRQLRFQAAADRHLARQILVKAQGLVRIRDGYVAGLLTPSGRAKTSVVSAKRSAAAKKAAATRKASGKKVVRKKTGSVAATRAANVARLNGQIRLLHSDARALIRSANHLDAMANGL